MAVSTLPPEVSGEWQKGFFWKAVASKALGALGCYVGELGNQAQALQCLPGSSVAAL